MVSLAILALLSLFAVAFVQLTNFERAASRNYSDAVRARLLARAGVRRAVVELQEIAGKRHYSDPKADGWGYALTAPTNMTEAQRKGLNLPLDLLLTTTPSFKLTNLGLVKSSEDPSKNRCDGEPHTGPNCASDPLLYGSPLAVSGFLGRSYQGGMDVYKLKILDTASQLNVNHPDPAAAQRMLKNLIRAAAEEDTVWRTQMTPQAADAIAAHVILNRPSSGFRSKAEVQALITIDPAHHSASCPCKTTAAANGGLALAGVTAANRVTEERWLEHLRDRITTHSWVDEKVIRPWNLNPDLPASHAYWQAPKRSLPLMRRAPVNLNTASRPVLVALFAGLEGRNDYGTFRVGYATAGRLADQLIAWRSGSGSVSSTVPGRTLARGPFKSWLDFETWLDHYATFALPAIQTPSKGAAPYIKPPAGDSDYQGVKTPSGGWSEGLVPDKFPYGTPPGAGQPPVSPTWCALLEGQGIRDLIKAQLNPNTMLNKFGQGANHGGRNQYGMPIARLVDKADIVHMTTEGCFDAMGVFEITSLGMVLRRDEVQAQVIANYLGTPVDTDEVGIVASQTLQVVLKVYDVARLTTQADFERFRAMMAPGDFIPDYQAWRNLPGVNRTSEAIMNSRGWPGLITQPVYSIVRDDLELHEIAGATPAQYDGHMTLTNLLGVRAQPWDFIAGFSRGTLDAFKCRVWWDPKDQNPFPTGPNNSISPGWPYPESGGALPFDAGNPSHPAGAFPPPSVGAADIDKWYAGQLPGVPAPDLTELDRLCSPIPGAEPPTAGKRSSELSPLDVDLAATPSDGRWWHEGAALWNNGVAIDPRRVDDTTGKPIALAYSGDNMNLYRACSIRVWVQPLADPYLREEEVLLSFIGSNGALAGNVGGVQRDVGWRVVKRASATGVSIALQACPSNNPDNGVSTVTGRPYSNPRNKNIALWAWQHVDGVKWRDVVEIDVTPDTKTRFANKNFKALSSIEPEWLANTWHWVVVNYGYARDNSDPASASLGFAQFDMSLQVDMRPTQPPRAYDPAEGTGRIAFMGDTGLSDGYGELHGHEHVPTSGAGMQPLGTANGIENDPISLPNRTSTHIWLEPRPLGDYYNCRRGGVTMEQREVVYEDVVTWNATTGEYETSQPINFPPQSFDHQVVLRYPDGSERNMHWVSSGGMFGNWTYNFLTGPPGDPATMFDYGADGVPGTADDVPMDIILRYREAIPASESPYCKAVETSPGKWTGAAMQHYANELAAGRSAPNPGNGDNQCVSQAYIHGRPPVLCPGGLPCWTVTNVRCTGQQAVISVPGGLSVIPPRMVCDGCRGCENCDVDAPLFLGGEPEGQVNLVDRGGVQVAADIDADTAAYAVFDNLVIKNLREFEARTDYASKGGFVSDPSNPGYEIPASGAAGTPNAPVDWYEDRFFELSTAAEHFDNDPDADPSQGFGATYRRGLLELIGQRTRLGSVTWTSYPTSDGSMQFEVLVYKLPGRTSGQDTWRGDNKDIMTQASLVTDANGEPGRSQILDAARTRVVGYKQGLAFGSQTLYDGLGDDSRDYEILMMGVQLGNLYKVGPGGAQTSDLTERQSYGFHTTAPGAPLEVLPSTRSGLPTPITETPVFEDITLNLLRETPQILYAEEGVSE
ncbi:MAG: hypothetical protein D6731_15650 [Planctomycetota bacterium]|nr:MAG: hypothetical protein D6731_15650 [Planctomycetota bacterium]